MNSCWMSFYFFCLVEAKKEEEKATDEPPRRFINWAAMKESSDRAREAKFSSNPISLITFIYVIIDFKKILSDLCSCLKFNKRISYLL